MPFPRELGKKRQAFNYGAPRIVFAACLGWTVAFVALFECFNLWPRKIKEERDPEHPRHMVVKSRQVDKDAWNKLFFPHSPSSHTWEKSKQGGAQTDELPKGVAALFRSTDATTLKDLKPGVYGDRGEVVVTRLKRENSTQSSRDETKGETK